jgi:ornithine carbamoyltransferase
VLPKRCGPAKPCATQATKIAASTGALVLVTEDLERAVLDVDFLYTDVWVSMGEPAATWDERIKLLLPYQINASVIAATHNPTVSFMHCLPALHNRDTAIGETLFEHTGMTEFEVTDDVFESPASIVFDQAENRLHTIKAIMVATLGR